MEQTPKSKLSKNRRTNTVSKSSIANRSKECSSPPIIRKISTCSTPIASSSHQNDDEFSAYSPGGFPTTQQGGRGDMDVIWDWSSPGRDKLTVPLSSMGKKNAREKERDKTFFEKGHLHNNRRTDENKPKQTKGNSLITVLDQLNAIKRQMNLNSTDKSSTSVNNTSNETIEKSVECRPEHHSTVVVDSSEEDVESKFETNQNLCTNFLLDDSATECLLSFRTPGKDTKVSVTEPVRLSYSGANLNDLLADDDSLTECMVKCSQVAELEFLQKNTSNTNDLNKNTVVSSNACDINKPRKRSLSIKKNKYIIGKETIKSNINRVDSDNVCADQPVIQNSKGNHRAQLKDDSFDDILSTLKEDELSVDKHSKNNISILNEKKVPFVLKFPSKLERLPDLLRSNSFTENSQESSIYMLPTQIVPVAKPAASKPINIFSRHSSMPTSPRVRSVGGSNIRSMIGRHSSMPPSPQHPPSLLNGGKPRRDSERTSSLESVDSRSCSPLQCTPEEIEKKRQDAKKRLEARRIQSDIERKRKEALAKLQRKAQFSNTGHRNVPG